MKREIRIHSGQDDDGTVAPSVAPLAGLAVSGWHWLVVLLITFLLLFLGMNRDSDFYDEGLILVGAMRVAAGQIPHRDFYANYGPAQFYTLAWLFHWFGASIFVERIYALTVRSVIVAFVYAITGAYCRRWLAICTAAVCALWFFSAALPGMASPIIPVILLVLAGSLLLLPMFQVDLPLARGFVAGGITGLVALFRYDVGGGIVVVHLASFGIAALLRRRLPKASGALMYALGVAVIFLPVALLYLAVAPLHPFIHDILLFPAKYYARARRLPFPRIHWRSLENLALYLPPVVAGFSIWAARREEPGGPDRKGLLVMFGLAAAVFYFKGIVRISIVQMLLSLVPTVIALAVLYEVAARKRGRLHRTVQLLTALSIFSATWSGLKEVRVLYLSQTSVLQEVLSPPGPASLKVETDWCGVPNRLHTGLCFLADPGHIAALTYLARNTVPSERIFVGLDRHDRLFYNDLLIYFTSDRFPATHWAHFDPDLQTRADIQNEMVGELERQAVRTIVLEVRNDKQLEPSNDSSVSSGVTILDDYIRRHYHQVEETGGISIWRRE